MQQSFLVLAHVFTALSQTRVSYFNTKRKQDRESTLPGRCLQPRSNSEPTTNIILLWWCDTLFDPSRENSSLEGRSEHNGLQSGAHDAGRTRSLAQGLFLAPEPPQKLLLNSSLSQRVRRKKTVKLCLLGVICVDCSCGTESRKKTDTLLPVLTGKVQLRPF